MIPVRQSPEPALARAEFPLVDEKVVFACDDGMMPFEENGRPESLRGFPSGVDSIFLDAFDIGMQQTGKFSGVRS